MGSVRERGRTRLFSVGLLAVLLLLVTGGVGYRVFVPRDTLDSAQEPYPVTAARATPALYGSLLSAPLLVDGRLRVYAADREVWADKPVDFRSSLSPYWAYRRWPAQLLGVAAVGTTVVSRWTDGQLVAIDATRGTVAWRTTGPGSSSGYTGRRTGAGSVYTPVGMYTAGDVLLVTGDTDISGYSVATGRLLWTKSTDRCATYFTGPSVFVAVLGCQSAATVQAYGAGDGRRIAWPALDHSATQGVTPFACGVGRSECRGVRTSGHAWLIGADGALSAAPALADPGSWLTGDIVVAPGPRGTLTGASLAGDRLWSWPSVGAAPAGVQVVAVEPGAVHVLTAARELISIDPTDGLELSGLSLIAQGNAIFDPGHVYAADRFVFVERLRPGAKESDPDSSYYVPSPNVLVTGS